MYREIGTHWTSLTAQLVKNPPQCRRPMQETQCSFPRLGRSAGEGISYPLQYSWTSLVAQLVKNPPAIQETWVWSLSQEDSLEKGKATHSSVLAWRIHGLYSPWGRKESDTTKHLSLSQCSIVPHFLYPFICPWTTLDAVKPLDIN